MAPTSAAAKSWTFMVYMAGDNNLDPEGVLDLKEMKKVGSSDRVNVIAQFDRASGHEAKRYYLSTGGQVARDAVAGLGEVNTGDPKRLNEFIEWGIDFCSLLAKALAGSQIARSAKQVVEAAQSEYVLKEGYKGDDLKYSHGVAIYFPTLTVSPLYAGLDFSKKTGWDGFLKAFLQAVRGR
jgi:hypothetical protein